MGIIHEGCPKCGEDNISRTRRITGYLVGGLENWNSYKQAEERDRVKHSV
jgi:ribonucleoside-triphosphate reductase